MTGLPFEMSVIGALAVLAASLWIPYIVGVNTGPEHQTPDFTRPNDPSKLRPWVHRAHRAHLNLLEQFVPFAILVLLLDRMDGFSGLTSWTALAFLLLRLSHAVGMITGIAGFPARPIIFTAGWVCCLIMGWAVLVAG